MGVRSIVLACATAVALLAPGTAGAVMPAGTFNAPGQRHADVCVRLAVSPANLRFSDGTPTGFTVNDQHAFDEDADCPFGHVRLDFHETIPSGAGTLVFHRGGHGHVDPQNVKYGQLITADLQGGLPPPTPAGGGRGAPCPPSGEAAHRVEVRSIPAAMHAKHPSQVAGGSNRGTSWEHYGDPGADQGSRTDIHYSYLLWSFLNVSGGGMVRTLLAPGQVVRPCDVESVTMPSWDRAGTVNGSVTARYVRTGAGTCPLYGWMVWSHTYYGESSGPVAHAVPAGGAPPPDPAPDPGCPAAEPASPPVAATGGSFANHLGEAALAGTVNSKGVPTAYWFEYGRTASYGQVTPERNLSSVERDAPVWSPVGGLEPGATYHYRVVARNDHGTTFGADATVAVPPPPLPKLSAVRLDPRRFRRARARRGYSARIRFTLSRPATVTLKFERKARGRWRRVGAAQRFKARAGSNKIKFGGWVGSKALPPGRYRVRVLPRDGKRAGRARSAGFRLRAALRARR